MKRFAVAVALEVKSTDKEMVERAIKFALRDALSNPDVEGKVTGYMSTEMGPVDE